MEIHYHYQNINRIKKIFDIHELVMDVLSFEIYWGISYLPVVLRIVNPTTPNKCHFSFLIILINISSNLLILSQIVKNKRGRHSCGLMHLTEN